jgi:hypothetical protein
MTDDADRPPPPPSSSSASSSASSSVATLLAGTEALAGDAALKDIATRVFEFTQFLLDDDENLTKVGNLDGEARARLQARCLELLGAAPAGAAADATDDGAAP